MDLAAVRAELSKLVGQPAWKVFRTHGSMFFLEIGQKLNASYRSSDGTIREYQHGEWHFLIECAFWRFETVNETMIGSEDAQVDIDEKFATLNLGVIKVAQINAPSNDLLIEFETGLRLKTFSAMVKADYNDWNLYCPDDYCWVADSGGRLDRRYINEQPGNSK
ncbi:MAG TPA: hypothetical protein VN175_03850 [Rhizomicrobium sp.]|nr:hypothetical protein [Rhizomicrobium sp.]